MIPFPHLAPRRVALACALLGAALASQASPSWVPDFEAKLHAGYGLAQSDRLNRGTLGYGVNFAWKVPAGRLGVELMYHYKNGDLYAGALRTDVPNGKQAVDLKNSVEQKRNDLKGFAVRVAYEGGLDLPFGLTPRAGLMIGGAKFRQEYVGDVRSLNWKPATPDAWRDTFHGTPSKGGLNLSPFVGVSIPVTAGSALEVQMLWLGYKAVDHVHMPGSALVYADQKDVNNKPVGPMSDHNAFPADRLAERSRLTPHLEIGWTFRF